MSTVAYPHVEVRSNGTAYIAGTGFKVRMLAEEHNATGADAMELQRGHPHLTLNQIYGALTYYYDHKQAFDRDIAEGLAFAEEIRVKQGESLLAKKLRELDRERP